MMAEAVLAMVILVKISKDLLFVFVLSKSDPPFSSRL